MTDTEPDKGSDSLCLQIEALRKLKSLLVKEARDQSPFKESKESTITVDKIEKYTIILDRLKKLYRKEKDLWDKMG